MPARKRIVPTVFLLLALLLPTALVFASTQPTYGAAVVDGDYSEWDLQADHFAFLYHAANPEKDVFADLYLRYDCDAEPIPMLYALVLVRPGIEITQVNDSSQHFIKLGNSNMLVNAGDAPDHFAFIGLSGDAAQGWEASVALAPASYPDLNVHTQVNDASGNAQTAAVEDRAIPFEPVCTPSAVSLASVTTSPTSTMLMPVAFVAAFLLLLTGWASRRHTLMSRAR